MSNGVITHEVGELYSDADARTREHTSFGNIDVTVYINYWDSTSKHPDGEFAVTADFNLPRDMAEDEGNFKECLMMGTIQYRALKELGFSFSHMIEEDVACFTKDGSEYQP